MWDDGQHQDGNAADGIFAASFPAAPATSEFYIYAENASASVFSPERAEFEFHTLSTFVANQPKSRVNEMIAVCPNPSTGILKVVFTQPGPQFLEIQNTIGQQVWKKTIQSGEQIRLENLPGGVYFLKIAGQTLKWILSK